MKPLDMEEETKALRAGDLCLKTCFSMVGWLDEGNLERGMKSVRKITHFAGPATALDTVCGGRLHGEMSV